MKALCWHGKHDVRVETVGDPQILNPHDAIIRVSASSICGSDVHIYDGYIPTLERGDILGHEFMGEVMEIGPAVKNLKVGDKVVVPFTISCGRCFFCKKGLFSDCENTNPRAVVAEKMYGHAGAGLFGFSHMLGGYAGGQAEYVRVPFADVGPLKVPSDWDDEKVLFLSDIFPTGYMAAEVCGIEPGDVVAIWGCGPVGQFAIKSAWLLGASRVIALDRFPEKLRLAQTFAGAEAINYEEVDVLEYLKQTTGGLGPDRCIDAVGTEAHSSTLSNFYDRIKAAAYMSTDRPTVLRQAIQACRSGGTVSVPGVYAGLLDKFNFSALFSKGLTLKTGHTHVQKYMKPLLKLIEDGVVDPSLIISHRLSLEEAPEAYKIFRDNEDSCTKVVLKPSQYLH